MAKLNSLRIDLSTLEKEEHKGNVPTDQQVNFIFFSLHDYSKRTQFLVLSAGIFVFYLCYGYFQELIFRLPGFKTFGWYLTLIQFALYALFSKVELLFRNESGRKIPLRTYFLLAFLTLTTMGFSNTSVGYINYPTQVVFKCCKLIPVMIGSIIIQHKKYGSLDFFAAILMSTGLIFFTLADSTVSPNFDPVGIVMISLALVADAVIGNVQEKVMKTYQASNVEVILYSYLIGFIYLLLGSLAVGSLSSAIQFCAKHPFQTYGYAMMFSVTGYFGIKLVLTLIQVSGAFTAVTVTTLRKALSIVISFLIFSKPFTIHYAWAGSLVVFGIYLNIYSKNPHLIPKIFSDWKNSVIALIRKNTKDKWKNPTVVSSFTSVLPPAP